MACHPNMTLNRDAAATQIPARLARPPRERRRRLPEVLIFVGFSETQYTQECQQPKLATVSGMPAFHSCKKWLKLTPTWHSGFYSARSRRPWRHWDPINRGLADPDNRCLADPNDWCLANWATIVCQKEELSTHWTSLYLSYSHPPSVFCEHRKSSWAFLEWCLLAF